MTEDLLGPVDQKLARKRRRRVDDSGVEIEPSRVPGIEQAFIERHQRAWGCQPGRKMGWTIPRQRRELKGLVESHADVELFALMDLFFARPPRSSEIQRCDYTLPDFIRLVPHLRLLEHRSAPRSSRTTENLNAVARATKE